MTQQIIDKATGQLKFGNDFLVSKKITYQELLNYFGYNNVSITDIKNGWKHYTIRNADINYTYFTFTFYFDNDTLKSVHFIISDNIIVAGSWDDWSEKKELEKRDYYDTWLTNEIGKTREFSWGTIGAYCDSKGGGTSIVLNYI